DDYLEPLFYSCLSVNRGESDYFSLFNCRIPYLNGGLFEAYGEYNWKETSFHIPDEIFSNNVDGILDIFDRYNFTISENEPYETEVAVDPEMLGKVFENLLDISDRKSKGAFYTPREIVHYMCKESLEKFLINKIDGISKIDIEYLIQLGEFTKGYDQHIFEIDYIKSIEEEIEFIPNWGMPKFVRENAKLIDDVLKNCKIVDPATGSGAFPLGMLTEIVKARNTLTMYIIIQEGLELSKTDIKKYWELKRRKENDKSLYNLKLNTIENSLFGVDLEPSAIEIAKLRLWLSIVVDTANESIKPLPNLDFNFRCGDSLVEDYYGVKLFDETILNKKISKKNTDKMKIEFTEEEKLQNIITLHHQFFNPYVKNKKGLKEQIENLEWKLIEANLYKNNEFLKIEEIKKLQGKNQKPYFIWKLEFGEVFRDNGGFDIVIGNPPYLRVQGIKEFNPELAETYKQKYKSATGSYDLYVLFTERALQLVKNNGIVNFIMPHKWTNASFGKGLREIIGLGKYMSKFISFGSYQVFNASTYTSLIWLEKTENQFMNYYEFNKDIKDNRMLESSLNSLIDSNYVKMDNLELKPLEVKKGNKISYKDKLWNFMPKDNQKIIDRISKHTRKCESIFTSMFQGIATSKDSVYFLHSCKELDDNLIEGYSQELEEIITIEKGIVKPLLKGDMVHRYDTLVTDKVVILPYNIENDKATLYNEEYLKSNFIKGYSYLKKCEDVLRMRESGKLKNDDKWYRYIYPKNLVSFKYEKLMAPDISLGCNFSHDNKGDFYSTTTIYGYIKRDEIEESYKFLMSILNSKVLWYYLVNTGAIMANGYFRFKTTYIKPFPIPEVKNLEITKPFENLVDYITFLKKEKVKFDNFLVSSDYLISFYEYILNAMVYELYFNTEMKENNLEIISFSQEYIPNILNANIDDSIATIKNTYLKLSESENEVRNNIILMKLRLEELIGPIDRSI
ncbi:MAG: Eco57I restriction-modification methylase domain-containing protein, partial [Fusobacteriaceae bacterium]